MCFNSPSVPADIVVGLWFTVVKCVAAVVDSELPLAVDVVVSGSVVVHVIVVVCSGGRGERVVVSGSVVVHVIVVVCSVVGIVVEEGEVGMPERIYNVMSSTITHSLTPVLYNNYNHSVHTCDYCIEMEYS